MVQTLQTFFRCFETESCVIIPSSQWFRFIRSARLAARSGRNATVPTERISERSGPRELVHRRRESWLDGDERARRLLPMKPDRRDLLLFLTAGSVDDGKSTLIERLLHDADAVYRDQFATVRVASAESFA